MTSTISIRRSATLGAIFLSLHAAHAQAQTVPGSAAPGRIDQRFNPPVLEPQPPAQITPVPQDAPMPAAEKLAQRFTLRAVKIEGMTAYPEGQFNANFNEKLGHIITVGEAYEIARAITAKYRADGYVLSQAIVTPKDLDVEMLRLGLLRIQVVEGFIDKVIVEKDADTKDSRDLIGKYAEKIRGMKPLKTETLERYMLLMNDVPGMTARAIIRPSAATFGAADLVIQVTANQVEASFTTDNRGNRFLGPYQEQLTLTENSVAGLGERTTVRAINSIPFSDLHYLDIQHEEQLGTEGTRLIAFASTLKTHPGGRLRPLNFRGESQDYSLTVMHPFLRSRVDNFYGRLMLDARNTQNSVSGIRLSTDRVRAVRMGANYNTSDAWNGVDLADATLSHGISGLGSTGNADVRSRTNGDQSFTKFNLDMSRLQSLPKGFSFLTALTGQASADQLFESEQFTLGGVGFGQAYDSGEISGDSGIAGKMELRYGRAVGEKWLDSYQLYSAYDIGIVDTNHPLPGIDRTSSLASLSAGVRLNFTPKLYGYLEAALPLTRPVSSENDDGPRAFFSLTARY